MYSNPPVISTFPPFFLGMLEDPEVLEDYQRFSIELPNRTGEKKKTWKTIVDFHNLKMGKDEDISAFAIKYLNASSQVTPDEMQACKFLFAFPIRIRELMTRYAGKWPRTLEGMMDLVQELVLRADSINVDIGALEKPEKTEKFSENRPSTDSLICMCFRIYAWLVRIETESGYRICKGGFIINN